MSRLLGVAAVVAALLGGAPAEAAIIQGDPILGRIVFQAAPGEVNDVTVSYSGTTGTYTVRDTWGSLVAADDCKPVSTTEAQCASTGNPWVQLELRLGDEDDELTVLSSGVQPTAYGEAGDDYFQGSATGDTFTGGEGDDTVGYSDFDSLSGGHGSDAIDFSDSGIDWILDLAAGTLFPNFGTTIDTTFENAFGGAGAETLLGNGDENYLDGGAGDDIMNGRFGPDTMVGGSGFDITDYSDRTAGVTIVIWPTITSGNADDTSPTAFGDSIHADVEGGFGGDGDDRFVGSDDANLFNGGYGADEYTGFGGYDAVDYSDRAGAVTVTLTGGANSGNAFDGPEGARDEISADVEDVIGGAGNDTLVGNGVDNVFDGGEGGDIMQGGAGDDLVDYSGRADGVLVYLDGTPRSGNDQDTGVGGDHDVLVEIEDALGGVGDDVFYGSGGANVFLGFGGNDVLNGEQGEDFLSGGAGDDRIVAVADGVVDTVSCGEQFDHAWVERVDVVEPGCESIDQGPPTVGATTVGEVTSTSVALAALVHPNRSPTGAWFEVRVTRTGTTASLVVGPLNGNVDLPVTGTVSGLLPGVTYSVRLVAQNGSGRAFGPDSTFTTANIIAPPPPPRPPAAGRCIVPNVKGKTLAAGRRALGRAKCGVGKVTRVYSRTVPKGRILRQSRRPRARLPRGTKVGVVVSRGKKPRARPRQR